VGAGGWIVARGYLPVDRDQAFLLPPDLRDWLPADHLVWFVLDVVGELDLGEFHARRRLGGAGRAGYDPAMMLALLVYAYALGERSSRQIERLCVTDVAFRVICAQHRPDHATIARFRGEHEAALAGLFGQVLLVCAAGGMGRFGTVALDGTKIAANAALSANRCEGWVRERAARILAEAAEVDAAEDDLFGAARGDELAREFADPVTRAQRIRAALAELDAGEAADEPARPGPPVPATGTAQRRRQRQFAQRLERAQARLARLRAEQQAKLADDQARRGQAAVEGRVIWGGSRPKPVDRTVKIRDAQAWVARLEQQARRRAGVAGSAAPDPIQPMIRKVNLTDPQSRIMMTRAGWVQGYNAQLVVSEDHLILATALTNSPVDVVHYQPLIRAAVETVAGIGERTGRADAAIGCVLADAGYASEANLTADGPDRLIALGRRHAVEDAAAHGVPDPGRGHATARDRMRRRLATPDGVAQYRRRGAIVEPIHGQLKDRRGLRRFSRRGQATAASELSFAAAVTNLLRLRTQTTPR
jgi:transposase